MTSKYLTCDIPLLIVSHCVFKEKCVDVFGALLFIYSTEWTILPCTPFFNFIENARSTFQISTADNWIPGHFKVYSFIYNEFVHVVIH